VTAVVGLCLSSNYGYVLLRELMSQWTSDPFIPVMRSGPMNSGEHDIDWRSAKPPLDPKWRFFGRAVSDDKTSIVAFLAAFDALKASGRKPSVNIKVAWEGEEEVGSTHLSEVLRMNQVRFAADLWMIGDAPIHQSRRQMLYFGARGSLGLEATVYGPIRAFVMLGRTLKKRAADVLGSATSPTTSPGACSRPADSGRKYALDREERETGREARS